MSDELHSFIEPELEARLIALILDEASPFEREELERLLSQQPEAAIWKRRMEAVHGLLGEAAQPLDDHEWKLSPERRAKVLALCPERTIEIPARRPVAWRHLALPAAACVALFLTLIGGVFSEMGKKESRAVLAEQIHLNGNLDGVAVIPQLVAEQRESKDQSLASQEESQRPDRSATAERFLKAGREAYKQRDFKAANQKYREALEQLPPDTATADQRRVIQAHLDDSALALAHNKRRLGKHQEAKELLKEAAAQSPGNRQLKRELASIDDPIRTNPAVSFAGAQVTPVEKPTTASKKRLALVAGLPKQVDELGLSEESSLTSRNRVRAKKLKELSEHSLKLPPVLIPGQAAGSLVTPATPSLERLPSDGSVAGRIDLSLGKKVRGRVAGDEPQRKTIKVPPNFWSFFNDDDHLEDEGDPFADADETGPSIARRETIKEMLQAKGLSLGDDESLAYDPGLAELHVQLSPENLEILDAITQSSRGFDNILPATFVPQKNFELQEISAAEKPDSTFSLNVSDVSFQLVKAALLGKGEMPPVERIRVEEFVNALDYDDASPSQTQKVACVIEQAAHPVMQQRNVMRVGMKTAALGRNATTPLRLTILLDRSGSMERPDRAASVRAAFVALLEQLNENDRLSLFTFDRQQRLLADQVSGDHAQQILTLLDQTPSLGGTNLEQALKLGLEHARSGFDEAALNRVILLTDGAANLGDAKPSQLSLIVKQMRQERISFDACGVSADGLNDDILESLTREGDGRYYLLDRPEDAHDGFARQIAGALRPAAKNVKVQVLFNPERVGNYHLYGYEEHLLKREDFRDDSVDAAEMAAEESGVAIYHYEPLAQGRGDIGTVSVRFLDTAAGQMVERTWTIPYLPEAPRFEDAPAGLQLATTAVLFAEKLKGTAMGQRTGFQFLKNTLRTLPLTFRASPLLEMVEAAE